MKFSDFLSDCPQEEPERGRSDTALDLNRGVFTLFSPDPYEIDINQVQTARDILDWYFQLKDKWWVTTDQLSDFLETMLELRNLPLPTVPIGDGPAWSQRQLP